MGKIRHQRTGATLELILDRPQKGNSLTLEMLESLESHLEDARRDARLALVVLRGAGPKFFCTGADMDALGDPNRDPRPLLDRYGRVLAAMESLPQWSFTVMNGDCVGGGLGLALATDYRLCVRSARLGSPRLGTGLFPFLLAPLAVRVLGEAAAKALCLGDVLWSAEESLQRGAVSEVVDSGTMEARADQLVKTWEGFGAEGLRRAKKALSVSRPLSVRLRDRYQREALEPLRRRKPR